MLYGFVGLLSNSLPVEILVGPLEEERHATKVNLHAGRQVVAHSLAYPERIPILLQYT